MKPEELLNHYQSLLNLSLQFLADIVENVYPLARGSGGKKASEKNYLTSDPFGRLLSIGGNLF